MKMFVVWYVFGLLLVVSRDGRRGFGLMDISTDLGIVEVIGAIVLIAATLYPLPPYFDGW